MTGYEKFDRCDNKLKSSKHAVKSIYLNFFKNIFLGFSETFTIKLPQVKILADLGEGFIGKKRVLVMVVYCSHCTQLHLENAGRRYCDNTRGSLKKKWPKE